MTATESYIVRVCERVISSTPTDELADAYPWPEVSDTYLKRRIWDRKVKEKLGKSVLPRWRTKPEPYDYIAIDAFMVKYGFTNRTLAQAVGVSKGIIDTMRSGWYNGKPGIKKVFDFMRDFEVAQ